MKGHQRTFDLRCMAQAMKLSTQLVGVYKIFFHCTDLRCMAQAVKLWSRLVGVYKRGFHCTDLRCIAQAMKLWSRLVGVHKRGFHCTDLRCIAQAMKLWSRLVGVLQVEGTQAGDCDIDIEEWSGGLHSREKHSVQFSFLAHRAVSAHSSVSLSPHCIVLYYIFRFGCQCMDEETDS